MNLEYAQVLGRDPTDPGFTDDDAHHEFEANLEAALAAAKERHESEQKIHGAKAAHGPLAPLTPVIDNQLAHFPDSDAGNAQRLVHRIRGRILYAPGVGDLIWDGHRFVRDPSELVLRDAIATMRATAATAEIQQDEKRRASLHKHARDSERLQRLRAMRDIARTDPDVHVLADDLDANPDLLNTLNCTINLRTGERHPHAPADRITRLVPVEYDPHATSPRWIAFQHRIADGDADLVAYKQRAIGYSFTGHTREQVFFIKYGTGSNGKTVEDEIKAAVAGDLAATVSFEVFSQTRTNRSKPDAELANLPGVRFVRTSESDAGGRLSESTIKDITGEGLITAKDLYKSPFQYRPRFKVWMATNHKPVIRGGDHGIWRRVHLIPYPVKIQPPELDPTLRDRLLEELPGILNWIVQGARDWYAHGLGSANAVHTATNEYRDEMDSLGGFLADATRTGEATLSARLHAAYRGWCTDNGERAISPVLFAQALTERGHTKRRHRTGVLWNDLTLTQAGDEWADKALRKDSPKWSP